MERVCLFSSLDPLNAYTDDEETMYKVIEHLTTPFPKWDKVSGISKEIKQFLALF